MRSLRHIWAPLFATFFAALLILPFATVAQEADQGTRSGGARDVVGFLEGALSDAGRTVEIDGFKGNIFGEARFDKLTIADAEGVWFTLEDADVNWDFWSLFGLDAKITTLSAKSIRWARPPSASTNASTLDAPEATSFALPDLPLAIDVQKISATKLVLGGAVLGLENDTELSLKGSASLNDTGAKIDVRLMKTKGARGDITLAASYLRATEFADINISFDEASDGIFATLAGIPKAPALMFSAQGSGTLDDLSVAIDLSTNGIKRVDGTVTLKGQRAANTSEIPASEATRDFEIDIAGDLRPLVVAELHDFFGAQSSLSAQGSTRNAGGVALRDAVISTRSATLVGAATLGANGLPEFFKLRGWIGRPDGAPVLLPSGSGARVTRLDLDAGFDAAKDNTWQADITARGFDSGFGTIATAFLTAEGQINDLDVSEVLAEVSGQLAGVTPSDPALAPLLSGATTLSSNLEWRTGSPTRFNNFRLSTAAADINGAGQVFGPANGFRVAGETTLEISDLSAFAGLAQQPIAGALSGKLGGYYVPLSGQFDLRLRADGQSLSTGIDTLAPLTGGQSDLSIDVKRDDMGITLERAEFVGSALSAEAGGILSSANSTLDFSAALDNLARIVPDFVGPATLTGQLSRPSNEDNWQSRARVTGPGGAEANLSGQISPSFSTANLDLVGTAPLGLSNLFTSAALTQGNAALDLSLNGPLALSSLNGQITSSNASTVINAVGLRFELPRARATLAGERVLLDISALPPAGGQIEIGGSLSLSSGNAADISIALADVNFEDKNLYRTELNGALTLSGSLTGTPLFRGEIALGQTDITVNPAALGSSDGLIDVTHVGDSPAMRQTRSNAGLDQAGLTGSASSDINLDVSIVAPNRIFLRGRGLDAEMGGQLQLRGAASDLRPVGEFSLIRGRLALLGNTIDLDFGQISLQGDLNPKLQLVASTQKDDLDITIALSGALDAPEITFSSVPDFPDEEILARWLFGRGLSNISAFEAARLASAIATLTGEGGGVVGKIRDAFGLDDLDLQTSDDGTSAVRLGRYINERLYTDVTIDSEGKSEINLNLDASDTVTLRGSAASDGETGLGVFFEKDY